MKRWEPMNFWREQRERIGVKSQRQMATILGVSNEAVRNWETDRCGPNLSIKFLAEKYQCTETAVERAIISQRRRIEEREEREAVSARS